MTTNDNFYDPTHKEEFLRKAKEIKDNISTEDHSNYALEIESFLKDLSEAFSNMPIEDREILVWGETAERLFATQDRLAANDQIEFKQIGYGFLNGKQTPRFVCSFTHFLKDEAKDLYKSALERSKPIGGTKYHTDDYSFGIAFLIEENDLPELINKIKNL